MRATSRHAAPRHIPFSASKIIRRNSVTLTTGIPINDRIRSIEREAVARLEFGNDGDFEALDECFGQDEQA